MPVQQDRHVDVLIAGGGIAGLLLARALVRRGRSVLVAHDPARPGSAFAAAVGLLNPVRGQRCTLPWRAADTFPHARRTYADIENETGCRAFFPVPIIRIFSDAHERELWDRRADETAAAGFEASPATVPDGWAQAPLGAAAVAGGGALDIDALRAGLIAWLRTHRAYAEVAVDPASILARREAVRWHLDNVTIRADAVVFAGGITDLENPFIPPGCLRPLKGESLTLRVDGLPPEAAYVQGFHLAPVGGDLWRCGGTREPDTLDAAPSPQGRTALESWVRAHLRRPWTIVSHHAGIRPVSADRLPIAGPVPGYERVYMLNGLGSQGLSMGPWLADALARHLVSEDPLHEDILPERFLPRPGGVRRFRAVEIARAHATAALCPGDRAVDLTTGNGGDTQWLAEAVGPAGHVYGFDIQPAAIHATRRRLEAAGLADRATLFCADHAELTQHLPAGLSGSLGAVVANLGYLPGSDSPVITRPDTTVRALEASLPLLRAGGVLVVVAYPGHPGGPEELAAVEAWADALSPERWSRLWECNPEAGTRAPRVLVIRRLTPPARAHAANAAGS